MPLQSLIKRNAIMTNPQSPADKTALEQMRSVLNGTKPFTVIERRKSEFTFKWIEDNKARIERLYSVEVMFHMNKSEGEEMLVSRDHTSISNYLNILKGDSHPTRTSKQKAFGALFGYSESDVDFWVNDSEGWKGCECTCSKCGGPITKEERASLDFTKWWSEQSGDLKEAIDSEGYVAGITSLTDNDYSIAR